jgi:hypothetical protein
MTVVGVARLPRGVDHTMVIQQKNGPRPDGGTRGQVLVEYFVTRASPSPTMGNASPLNLAVGFAGALDGSSVVLAKGYWPLFAAWAPESGRPNGWPSGCSRLMFVMA